MSLLESIIRKSKFALTILATSFALSCSDCDGESFREMSYCEMQAAQGKFAPEICGNDFDEDCDGNLNNGCDDDLDGYCDQNMVFEPTAENYQDICPQSFAHCQETAADCKPIFDCFDDPQDTVCRITPEQCGEDYSRCAACINPGAIERCDWIDNNCNRAIDENDPQLGKNCYENENGSILPEQDRVGVCQAGIFYCRDGELQCEHLILAREETCNGKDDDCDGEIDATVINGIIHPLIRECYGEWQQSMSGYWRYIDYLQEGSDYYGTMGVGICLPGYEYCPRTCPENDIYCQTGVWGGNHVCTATLPGTEECDYLDNDCNGETDEVFDLDGDGYKDKIPCDANYSEPLDCDDNDPNVNPGAVDLPCNGKDDNCDGIENNGTDEDHDGYATEGGLCGPIDCNDHSADTHPGAIEICDCDDNNCNGQIDEGTQSTTGPIDLSPAFDCSGSMWDIFTYMLNYVSDGARNVRACYRGDKNKVNTSYISQMSSMEPVLARHHATILEFQDNLRNDIPVSCPGDEFTLDYVIFTACAVPGMEDHQICQAVKEGCNYDPVRQEWYCDRLKHFLQDPNDPEVIRQFWREGSEKYIFLFADEAAQCKTYVEDPVEGVTRKVNQEEVGQLVRDAGIKPILFVEPQHFNTLISYENGAQGYQHLVLDENGQLNDYGNGVEPFYPLRQEVNNQTLSTTFEKIITKINCQEEE